MDVCGWRWATARAALSSSARVGRTRAARWATPASTPAMGATSAAGCGTGAPWVRSPRWTPSPDTPSPAPPPQPRDSAGPDSAASYSDLPPLSYLPHSYSTAALLDGRLHVLRRGPGPERAVGGEPVPGGPADAAQRLPGQLQPHQRILPLRLHLPVLQPRPALRLLRQRRQRLHRPRARLYKPPSLPSLTPPSILLFSQSAPADRAARSTFRGTTSSDRPSTATHYATTAPLATTAPTPTVRRPLPSSHFLKGSLLHFQSMGSTSAAAVSSDGRRLPRMTRGSQSAEAGTRTPSPSSTAPPSLPARPLSPLRPLLRARRSRAPRRGPATRAWVWTGGRERRVRE